jgi:hypothetical protein
VTSDDLLILIPWLLFAASVAIIVLVVLRHRPPPCPNAKSAGTSGRQPDGRVKPAGEQESAPAAGKPPRENGESAGSPGEREDHERLG